MLRVADTKTREKRRERNDFLIMEADLAAFNRYPIEKLKNIYEGS